MTEMNHHLYLIKFADVTHNPYDLEIYIPINADWEDGPAEIEAELLPSSIIDKTRGTPFEGKEWTIAQHHVMDATEFMLTYGG
jgi:hypothetical protein